MGGGWSRPCSSCFTPGKETHYPRYRRLGKPQGRPGRVRKISPPTGIRSLDHPTRSGSLSFSCSRYHMMIYDMIYLTAIGLPTGGSSTVHIYKQTIHRTTQNKQYIEQHKNVTGIVRVVPRLGELYPGICLTSEEKARKNIGQGSWTIRIHRPNNKNT
jgi:hypothetical protein